MDAFAETGGLAGRVRAVDRCAVGGEGAGVEVGLDAVERLAGEGVELDSDEGVCGGAEEAVGDGGAAEAVAAVVAGVVDALDLGSLLHGFAICRSRSAVALGTRAAELLLEEAGDQADDHCHDQVVLRPELVVRRSSLTPR